MAAQLQEACGPDVFRRPWPPEAVSLSLGSKMEQQDFKQQSDETRSDNSCLRSKVPGSWPLAFCVHPTGQNGIPWPHGAVREAGNVTSMLRGPLCPATNSTTMRRGGSGSWNTSRASCHAATSPLPAAHRPVQSRDSFHYLLSQSSWNKCSLDSGERRWEVGPNFVWRWQRTQSSCFRNSRGTS